MAKLRREQQATAEKRVRFMDERGSERANIFVRVGTDGADTVLSLLHDYRPDEFAPQVGWRVLGRGLDLTITAVAGRRVTCAAHQEG